MKYNDEQLRVSANLKQYYEAWLEAKRTLLGFDYHLSWQAKNGVEYLRKRSGAVDTSIGVRSPATEAVLAEFLQKKAATQATVDSRATVLQMTCRQYGALRLGRIASSAAAILREADIRGYLGPVVMVVGTNALPAYEQEAASPFATGMTATEDFDMAWRVNEAKVDLTVRETSSINLLTMLKAVDSTYTVNTERTFQARNREAYEVELLVAPSRAGSMPRTLGLSPIPMPEQEWLLQGTPVDQVVCGMDNSPAHIVAPDPRWFALHKLWMSVKAERNPTKKPKDRRQGMALLDAIVAHMPHYPVDADFRATLPAELASHFDAWQEESSAKPASPGW